MVTVVKKDGFMASLVTCTMYIRHSSNPSSTLPDTWPNYLLLIDNPSSKFPPSVCKVAMALNLELNSERFLKLLEKLIGESEFLQNNPPRYVPQEDRCDSLTVQMCLFMLWNKINSAQSPMAVKTVYMLTVCPSYSMLQYPCTSISHLCTL